MAFGQWCVCGLFEKDCDMIEIAILQIFAVNQAKIIQLVMAPFHINLKSEKEVTSYYF